MDIYLPIAGVDINIFILIGLGYITGILSGLFGIGGGFFLVPFLIFLGISPSIATATSLNQIIGSSICGSFRHFKIGNIDIKMGLYIFIGGFWGGSLGVYIVNILLNLGNFEFFIKVFYVITLAITGISIFIESLMKICKNCKTENKISKDIVCYFQKLPLQTFFTSIQSQTSIFLPILIGFIGGIFAGLMGLGGGFIMVPLMIYFIGMPTKKAIGTSLFQIIFASINITVQQIIFNHNVDVILAIAIFLGSVFGANTGAKLTKFFKSEQLRLLYSITLISIMIKFLLELIVKPITLVS